jgi:hypothetical protein
VQPPAFLFQANEIHRRHPLPFRGTSHCLPLLAEGYAYFFPDTPATQDFERTLGALLDSGKTVVLDCPGHEVAAAAFDLAGPANPEEADAVQVVEHTDGSVYLVAPDLGAEHCHRFKESTLFLVTDSYLLRRYVHGKVQEENRLGGGADLAQFPVQVVRFMGLGPSPDFLDATTTARIASSDHVVLFDRTRTNIVSEVPFNGTLYEIPYDYENFDQNLYRLNTVLAALHRSGALNVVVLIEGNPEVYDFAEGLSTYRRRFEFEVASPLIYLSSLWVESAYGLSLLNPGYLLTSGFNARHGITTQALLGEIERYLESTMTFMVMEMFRGDLPLVLDHIREAPRPKSVIMLTNMFSPNQRAWFLPTEKLGMVQWAQTSQREFTTLIIIDNDRLARNPPEALASLHELEPGPQAASRALVPYRVQR